ncbi:MAG TPA: thioesterase family protein [Verrucomicrobiota bacterium]|nr:thioesterase family protein [Verrucomicrobiota bacterium]HNT13266.1 thioesterase family protein [Verrucomicrobiota bacterium]
MSDQRFVHPYRVTYRDCTLGNHVYYANYLGILEAARGEFFRQLGAPLLQWQEAGLMFPVVEARLQYLAPARYDDLLNTEVWLTRVERVRFTFGYQVTNHRRTRILRAETGHACLSLEEKLKRLPESLVAALQSHLRAGD